MRAATRASSGPSTTERSSSRASASGRPRTVMIGSPSTTSSTGDSPTDAMKPTRSAYRRRAMNPSTCADSRSTQCPSSMTHSSGWSSAARDSSVSAPSPTRNRSGGGPSFRPNAIIMASRCGAGNVGSSGMNGISSWCRAANSRLISDSTPMTLEMRRSGAESMAYSSSVVLPAPGPPCSTSVPLKPLRTESSTRSMAARSRWRSTMACLRCCWPPACRSAGGHKVCWTSRPATAGPSSPSAIVTSSLAREQPDPAGKPDPHATTLARLPRYLPGAVA